MRLWHFIRSKNLPYLLFEVKQTCQNCNTCAEIKLRFYQKPTETLISATQPWQRISLDFKGPVKGKNNYLLIVIDEYSRFLFVFPCPNMTAQTVINCLTTLFCMFGLPGFIHTDCDSCFSAKVFKDFLHFQGIATSRTTPYHPTGNSQNECWNQTIWRRIKLMLHSRRFPEEAWENALHSTRSLLCTSTNSTPYNQFFQFHRRSMLGKSIPTWLLNPGPVFLQNVVRNKGDSLCYEVKLFESNSKFAHVCFKDGKECTVSTKDLVPKPCQDSASDNNGLQTSVFDDNIKTEIAANLDEQQPEISSNPPLLDELQNATEETSQTDEMLLQPTTPDPRHELRWSTQIRKAPICYGSSVPH